jgi:Tfp pilus assembly protein PilN
VESIKINLATFEYQDKRLVYPVMLISALVVLLISFFSIKIGINTRSEIKEYEKTINLQEQNVLKRQQIKKESIRRLKDGEITSLKKDINFINELIEMDAYPYDRLLDALEACMPQGIVLSALNMSKDLTKVTLEGDSDSMEKISIFINNLNDSKILKNNNLLNLTVSREGSKEEGSSSMDNGISFEIESSIDNKQIWGKKPDDR